MSVVRVVANGQDNYASWLSILGGSALDTRIATYLAQYDQVLNVAVEDKSRIFSIWGGSYPFQAVIDLDTKNMPSDVTSVVERVKLAIVQATGYQPSAVSVTSAGQPTPAPPARGTVNVVEDLIQSIGRGLNIGVEAAKWVLVAIALGLIALIYFIATQPGKAARIARA